MQLTGNPGSFREDQCKARTHPAYAEADGHKHSNQKGHCGDRPEPAALIKKGLDAECERRRCHTPKTIRTARFHLEREITGRQIRVKSLTPRTGIDPVAIVALELIAEGNLFGIDKAQAGVANFKIIGIAGFQLWRLSFNDTFSVRDERRNSSRRRDRIATDAIRTDDDQSTACRKPEVSIARTTSSRLNARSAFKTQLSGWKRIASYRGTPAIGEFVKLARVQAKNAFARSNPEISTVAQNAGNASVIQPVLGIYMSYRTVLPAHQAGSKCPHPKRMIRRVVGEAFDSM